MDRIAKAADIFLAARKSDKPPAGLGPDSLPQTPAEAYAVQKLVGEKLGSKPAGWKVSLFNDGNAVFAPILAALVARSGTTHAVGPLPRIGIELEFGFHFARTVAGEATPGAILDAIEAVTVTIELCQTRFASPDGHPPLAALADFQNNAGAVIGTRKAFDRKDPFAGVRTELLVDGRPVLEKVASHPNGDPLAGLMILPGKMREHGCRIEAGQFVITGSFIGMNWFDTPNPGTKTHFEGRIGGFGAAGIDITA